MATIFYTLDQLIGVAHDENTAERCISFLDAARMRAHALFACISWVTLLRLSGRFLDHLLVYPTPTV